ncbi:MAG: alpha/beta hydrolase [Solirubrobacterales bacterium]|nr:alpha/beta hydrolase [Solirubrobacterales bacterium]
MTNRVIDWRSKGKTEEFRGRRIHVFQQGGEGTPILLLHGFPSSSFDWQPMLDSLPGRRILAFDFLGFGLSDKPKDHTYSLMWQADLTEELVRRNYPDEAVFLVAHDMGTSVSTELFARDIRGELGFEITGAMLFNGSMILEKATLTRSQKLLRGPLGPLASRLASRRVFAREFGAIFSPEHPLTSQEATDQWSLICHNGGRKLGNKLIHYLEERAKLTDRWHGAIRDWPGDLSFAWGELDPVATTSVLDAVLELRPSATVQRFPNLGHYPQIEDPAAIAGAILKAESAGIR